MKLTKILLAAVALMLFGTSVVFAYPYGPLDNFAGNPPLYLNCTFCHNSFPVNSGSGTLSISGVPAFYTPGQTYTVTVTLSDPHAMRWGFELTAMLDSTNGAGTFTIIDTVDTQLSDHAADSADFVKHTLAGSHAGTSGSSNWSFDWTAPTSGGVTFYFAGNAANNDTLNTGDYIYTNTATSMQQTFPPFTLNLDYVSGSPVPAGGGNIFFDIFVQYNGTTPIDYDAWLAVEYEGGPPTTVVLRPLTNFQPGWAINRPNTSFPVPGTWAAGNYVHFGRVGDEPNVVWNEDSFPWIKSGAFDGSYFQPHPVAGAENPFDYIDKSGTAALPAESALNSAYPNPFNPSTVLSYTLQTASNMTLSVYDLQGREVAVLVEGYRNAGLHQATFDASHLSSGVYIAKLTAGNQSAIAKLILMK